MCATRVLGLGTEYNNVGIRVVGVNKRIISGKKECIIFLESA